MTDTNERSKAQVRLMEYLALYDRCERILDLQERQRTTAISDALDKVNDELRNATDRLHGVVHALEPDDRLRRAAKRVQGAYEIWMGIDVESNPAFEPFVEVAGDEYHAAMRELREALTDA